MTFALVIICMFVLLAFVSFYGKSEEQEEREASRGWRVINNGGEFNYEERINGEWRHIKFEVIRKDYGHGIHGIRIKSQAAWLSYPQWAVHRREEIISRVKEELSQFRFYTEKEPNQALQTTPPAVTPRADARVAPSGSVSDF